MSFVFFAIMLLLCEVSFLLAKKDILSPWFLLCVAFSMGALSFAVNYFTWGMPFHFDTMLILLLGILSFGVGGLLASYTVGRSGKRLVLQKYGQNKIQYHVRETRVSTRAILILSEIVLITDVWSVLDSYRVSVLGGNENGMLKMLSFIRQVTLYSTAETGTPFLLKQLKYFCIALTFFFLLLFLYDCLYLKRKPRLLYLLPPVLSVVQMTLTAGRMVFLRTIVFILIAAIVLYTRRIELNRKSVYRVLKYVVIAGIAFFVIFRLSGFLTGKSTKFSFYDNITLYLGGSLPAFDDFLRGTHESRLTFGAETLQNFQRPLYKLGLVDTYKLAPLEWMQVYGMSFNTYTAVRRYFHDFGYAGVVLLEGVMGYFFTRLYLYSSRREKGFFLLLVYASIFYPVLLQQIEDQFYVSVLSFAVFCQCFYAACLYWFFIGRKQPKPRWLAAGLRFFGGRKSVVPQKDS